MFRENIALDTKNYLNEEGAHDSTYLVNKIFYLPIYTAIQKGAPVTPFIDRHGAYLIGLPKRFCYFQIFFGGSQDAKSCCNYLWHGDGGQI